MKCEEVREQLTQVAVEGRVGEQIELHLSLCRDCRREAEELSFLWSGLGSLEEDVPTELLRARFQGMVESYEEAQLMGTHRLSVAASPDRWQRVAVALFAAAACLLIGVGIGRQTVQSSGTNPEIASLRDEVTALNQLVALGLMQQTSSSSRLEGVTRGQQLNQPGPQMIQALSERAASDPNVNVRLAAVEALAPLADDPQLQQFLVETLTQQSSPLVQIAMIDLLLLSDETAARQRVLALLEDNSTHPDVQLYIRQRLGSQA